MFHGDEFSTKDGSLDGRLPLGNPLNKSQVAEDQDARSRMTGTLATSMVAVAHHANFNFLPQEFRHVMRNCFRHIIVELGPVILGKVTLINDRVSWVKYKSRIVLLLQVPHYVECSLKVAFARKSEMRG
jgi:hypothetical protein